jgi:hypothetical protein
MSFDQEFLKANLDGKSVECPTTGLQRLDVLVGERKWWKASLIGLGIGLGVGGIGVVAITSDSAPEDDMAGLAAALWAVTATSAGLVTGTIVGLIRGSKDWRAVDLPPSGPFLVFSGANRWEIGFSIRDTF